MKHIMYAILIVLCGVALSKATYESTTVQDEGKTGLKDLCRIIDANIVQAGYGQMTVTAVANVTNAQPLALVGGIQLIKGHGGTNEAINTITFPVVTTPNVGKVTMLVNVTGASNLIAVASTGTYLGPAIELAAGQSAMIVAAATNQFYSIGNQ